MGLPVSFDLTTVPYGILGQGWVPLLKLTGSTSATLDFEGILGLFDVYAYVFTNIISDVDNRSLALKVSEDGGTSYAGGTGYEYNFILLKAGTAGITNGANSQGGANMQLSVNTGNATAEGLSGILYLYAPNAQNPRMTWDFQYINNAATPIPARIIGGGVYNGSSNAINAIQFLFTSDNILSGTIEMYGLVKGR